MTSPYLKPTDQLVRFVAVGNRIHLVASEERYVAELERIVSLAAPHLAGDGPKLLVLAEVLGLPAALVGRCATLARRARHARTALTLLALAELPRLWRVRRHWPDIPLARALLLARTDALYRPFTATLSRLAARHRAYVIASTLAPRVLHSTDAQDIARWGRRGAREVYVPLGPEVYNVALVFTPAGELLGRVEKVFLTKSERTILCLTPGRLEDVPVFATPAGRIGVAISLDAFTPDYLRRLDALGAEIVAQPDANDQLWAAPSATYPWQPEEWLGSVLGSIQPWYPHMRYNVCAMQTGNFFDTPFDGQSSITTREAAPSKPGAAFVGVDALTDTQTGEPLVGGFLAVAPWVVPDPVTAEPGLPLDARRARLATVARLLLSSGARANQYRESAIWADARVHSAHASEEVHWSKKEQL
jgi:predicted amidohydrolase